MYSTIIGWSGDPNTANAGCLRYSDDRALESLVSYRKQMKKPPLDPDVADFAPTDSSLTKYDEEHIITYLRLLDADKARADWTEVARIVLHIDPASEPERARHAFDSHLARAKWMTEHGYRHFLAAAHSIRTNDLVATFAGKKFLLQAVDASRRIT
jgi:type VI secretion system activator RovC-like protein